MEYLDFICDRIKKCSEQEIRAQIFDYSWNIAEDIKEMINVGI